MKKKLFTIPSLLAAGLFATPSLAEEVLPAKSFLMDDISDVVSSITEAHEFTLAGHRSHGSHGSHGSHRSHRSGWNRLPLPNTISQSNDLSDSSSGLNGTRNNRSTPPKSVLPSSPKLANKKKVLPGNSLKFQEIIIRVQSALYVKNIYDGPLNGDFNAKTVEAIYRFQAKMGMVPSGKVTEEVLGTLGIVAQ